MIGCVNVLPQRLELDAPGTAEWPYYIFRDMDCSGPFQPNLNEFAQFDIIHEHWPFNKTATSFYIPPHAELELFTPDQLLVARLIGPLTIKDIDSYIWSWHTSDNSPCPVSSILCGKKINRQDIGSWRVHRIRTWSQFLTDRNIQTSQSTKLNKSIQSTQPVSSFRAGNIHRTISNMSTADDQFRTPVDPTDLTSAGFWLALAIIVSACLLVFGFWFYSWRKRKPINPAESNNNNHENNHIHV